MATMATMATPELKLEKKMKRGVEWGDNQPTNFGEQLAPPGGNSADDVPMATMATMATPS